MPQAEQTIDTSAPEFQAALNMIRFTHQSVFLTGRAGTGKSTFLRYVRENTRKKCVVLAPTGIAAINAGGVTLHSFFKLPLHPLTPDDSRYAGQRIRDFLIVDRVKPGKANPLFSVFSVCRFLKDSGNAADDTAVPVRVVIDSLAGVIVDIILAENLLLV